MVRNWELFKPVTIACSFWYVLDVATSPEGRPANPMGQKPAIHYPHTYLYFLGQLGFDNTVAYVAHWPGRGACHDKTL